ncbi:hypothetical protein R1flu_018400 [Riccia fluitans]|uniref:Uncharacterized protein n=1 Tax=Riccia fluitans TaxID=41844 RepID=A0ABD1ZGR0_9MARC
MKGGTERMFTAANFSNDGSQLATVGGHPDYWLTVWDWENETMILCSKAFSQEVFKVNFSTYFTGQLITSGVGHIRFWKMASTFTGLKLEGAIAKFGMVPISDVAGYVELQNSKVLSGTESGSILVWDDGLIKAQLKRPGENMMCHDANDGDDKLVCEINPVREIHVGEDVKIKGIICEADHWIIQDEDGALWNAKLPNYEMEKILDFHAGPITCVASSPVNYDLASGGSDGTVPGAVTSMDWAPNGKHLLVGCHNGDIVEVTRPGTDGDTTRSFELILTMKAYTFRRPKIKKSKPPPKVMPSIKTEEPPKEEALPSPTSEEPKLGDVTLGQEQAEALTTDQNLEGGTTNEGSKEEQVSAMEPQDGTKEKSEEAPPEFHSHGKPSQVEAKPAEVLPLIAPIQEEEPDDPPGNTFPVRALMYTHGSLGTFYLALEGRASGYIYECHIDSEEVLGYMPWLASVKFMHFTRSSEFLISGSDDGMLRVQKVPPPGQLKLAETDNYWEAGVHDGFYGVVGGAVLSYDEKYLVSVSYDESFFVQSFDMGKGVEMLHHKPPDAAKLEQNVAAEIEDVTGVALSIEEQRAKTEQDERLRLAIEKKNVVLAKVDTLRGCAYERNE